MSQTIEELASPITQKYIVCVSPPIYHITGTDEIRSRHRYRNIDNWGWMNLRELTKCAIQANSLACIESGKPKVKIPWIVSESDAGLVQDFGSLMWGNRVEQDIRYTFVRCTSDLEPTTSDFNLEEFKLPSNDDCAAEIIYIPSSWGTEVLGFIRQRIYKVELVKGFKKRQVYFLNGEVGYTM